MSVSPREHKDDEPMRSNGRRHSVSGSRSRDKGGSRSRSRGRDKRDKNPETYTQIYIAKLSRKTREEELREHFGQYGRIKDIVLKTSYGFIDFEDHESAEKAVRGMNGKTFINGEELVVEQSVPGGKKRRTGPGREDVCYNCQKKGHWANECKSRRRSPSGSRRRRHHSRSRSYQRRRRSRSRSYGRSDSRSKDLKEGRCFGCGERGHIKRDCPKNGGRMRSRSPRRGGGGGGGRRDDEHKKRYQRSSSRSESSRRSRGRGDRRRSGSGRSRS